MNPDIPAGLDPQLLDDFFSEADEHLLCIREGVQALESSCGKGPADPSVVKKLFGAFHSLKGICALVGLGPAEAVAHKTEDCLRLMRESNAEVTGKTLEVIGAAARKLEQIVAAFASHKPLPSCDSVLKLIAHQCGKTNHDGLVQKTESEVSSSDLTFQLETAKAENKIVWRYSFFPTKELNSAGVTVNSVRAQLAEIGDILKATPHVKGKDGLTFEFIVASKEGPTDLAAWEAKGITVVPYDDSEAPATSAASIAEGSEQSPFLTPSHIVRVDLKRLDELMRITGEMVIQRSRLDAELAQVKDTGQRGAVRGVQDASSGLGRSLRELREAIMRVRLVPMAEIFARMPFVVRDLAKESQKQVKVKLSGQDTSIDKYVVERLKDPLLHLVRNAISHGVETPEERMALSKPPEATIELSAGSLGDSVTIRVSDDGRGIDRESVVQRARKLGHEFPATLDDRTILRILCLSGFSTRDNADRASGRGVGMTVVQTTVRELGGHLTLQSERGRGTQFTIRLPLTLAILDALIVSAAGQRCAVPQGSVREIIQAQESELRLANEIEVMAYRGGLLPIIRLANVFHLPSPPRPKTCVLVVSSERGSVGLLTEQVLGQREVVVSSLRDPLIQVSGISGATELGDGKPVFILDAAALTAGSVRPHEFEGELQPHGR